jgi:hypothetical protein
MKKGGGAPVFRRAFRSVTAFRCHRCHAACWRTASAVHCQSGEGKRVLWRSEMVRERPCHATWRNRENVVVSLPVAPVDDARPLDMQSTYQRVAQPPLAALITLGRLGDAVAVAPVSAAVQQAPSSRHPPVKSAVATRLRVAMPSPAAQGKAGDSTCICM